MNDRVTSLKMYDSFDPVHSIPLAFLKACATSTTLSRVSFFPFPRRIAFQTQKFQFAHDDAADNTALLQHNHILYHRSCQSTSVSLHIVNAVPIRTVKNLV